MFYSCVRPMRNARNEIRALARERASATSRDLPWRTDDIGDDAIFLEWEAFVSRRKTSSFDLLILVEVHTSFVQLAALPKICTADDWRTVIDQALADVSDLLRSQHSFRCLLNPCEAASAASRLPQTWMLDTESHRPDCDDIQKEVRRIIEVDVLTGAAAVKELRKRTLLINQYPHPRTGITSAHENLWRFITDNKFDIAADRNEEASLDAWMYPLSSKLDSIAVTVTERQAVQREVPYFVHMGNHRSIDQAAFTLRDIADRHKCGQFDIPPNDHLAEVVSRASASDRSTGRKPAPWPLPDFSDSFPRDLLEQVPLLGMLRPQLHKKPHYGTPFPVRECQWWPWNSGRGVWSKRAQDKFNELMVPAVEDLVDQLIEDRKSLWPIFITEAVIESESEFAALIEDTIADGRFEVLYNQIRIEDALRWGTYHATLDRRVWDFPTRLTCIVCGIDHFADCIWNDRVVRSLGIPNICGRCAYAATYRPYLSSAPYVTKRASDKAALQTELINTLHLLHTTTGLIPGSNFHMEIRLAELNGDAKRIAAACKIALPEASKIREILECGSWLEALTLAGILEGTRATPRGTMCLAKDGHLCRSIGEKTIDDWLYDRGIEHEVEPRWPLHSEYNPNGLKRADWKVGEIFIEYAGLMGDDAYEKRLLGKQRLAESFDIELIILKPEHLNRLESFLGDRLAVTPHH